MGSYRTTERLQKGGRSRSCSRWHCGLEAPADASDESREVIGLIERLEKVVNFHERIARRDWGMRDGAERNKP